jgi:hypothetical protein
MAGPVVYYMAGLFFTKIPGNVMAQNSPRGQTICKAGDLVRVAFTLRLGRRRFPMQKNIAAACVTAARIVGVCRFLFMNTVRGKSNDIITVQPGAKRIAIAAILATKAFKIFSGTSDKARAVYINRFTSLPKIKRNGCDGRHYIAKPSGQSGRFR